MIISFYWLTISRITVVHIFTSCYHFFLLFVFLKQAFHSLEWCTLNKRLTQIRADFQGPKFEISAQELEGMNMVF